MEIDREQREFSASQLEPQSESTPNISERKKDHIDICLKNNVNSQVSAGWDKVRIPHCALPEINFDSINLAKEFLGHPLETPFLISSMTGGTPSCDEINLQLARACEKHQMAMGLGSLRIFLEEDKCHELKKIRREAPNSFLAANIGLVQFNYGVSVGDCQKLIDSLEANALILHCNVLQEAIQFEGDRDFSDLFSKLEKLKKSCSVPLILKETGSGLDAQTCQRAVEAGIDCLDIAGMGGSHWGFIEGLRHPKRKVLGEIFRDWGIPSLEALQTALNVVGKNIPVIASGGLKNGLDAAKAYYIGASLVGFAKPFLTALKNNEESLDNFIVEQKEALKIALFCSGSSTLEELSHR